MSEIAGRLAAQAGAYFLEKPQGGRGLLLSGVPGVARGSVVVIGGGMVGYNAALIALGLGANVTILERSIDRMRQLEEILGASVSLLMSSALQIEESVADADVVIGAVLIPGAVAPKLVTREMVAGMKEGLGHRRRRDRPGRLRRDGTADDAQRPGLHGRRRDALLRREHAGRRARHVDEGAHERDAAVRRGDRRPRARRGDRARPALARGVNVLDGKVTYEAVAEAASRTRRSRTSCRSPRSRCRPASAGRASASRRARP